MPRPVPYMSCATVEAKSGATLAGDFFTALSRMPDLVRTASEGRSAVARLIYGGDARQDRSGAEVIPWSAIQDVAWG